MKVTCFASGSSGNAFLVQHGATRLLLDAGLGVRVLRERLATFGIDDDGLDAILISHEHDDHIAGLSRLLSYHSAPVLASRGTCDALPQKIKERCDRVVPGMTVQVGALSITPVAVSHDAAEPVGFVLDAEDVRAAIFTDLGTVVSDVSAASRGAALLVIESNYDEEMLARGRYPAHLKRRITGPQGHLSNTDCSAFLAAHVEERTSEVWLAHLSKNNNRPSLARTAALSRLSLSRPEVRTLPRSGAAVSWDSETAASRPRQLNLF